MRKKRDHILSVRLSLDELATITAAAEANRQTISEFIRVRALRRAESMPAVSVLEFNRQRLQGILDDCASDPSKWQGMSKRAAMLSYSLEFGVKLDFDWPDARLTAAVERIARQRLDSGRVA